MYCELLSTARLRAKPLDGPHYAVLGVMFALADACRRWGGDADAWETLFVGVARRSGKTCVGGKADQAVKTP